jgi:hypothetical protein
MTLKKPDFGRTQRAHYPSGTEYHQLMDVTRAMMYPARSRERLATFGQEYRDWTRSRTDVPFSLANIQNQTHQEPPRHLRGPADGN